jgi:hypothetical protein
MNRNAVRALITAGEKDGWIVRAEEYVPSKEKRLGVFAPGEAPPEPAPDTVTD